MNGIDPVEERVARYLAAWDWLGNATATDRWWSSRTAKFRGDYLAFARDVIAIVREGEE